jgi:hypothetical protein
MSDLLESQFAIPDHRREHVCELVNESFEELLATDLPVIRLLGASFPFSSSYFVKNQNSFVGWFQCAAISTA